MNTKNSSVVRRTNFVRSEICNRDTFQQIHTLAPVVECCERTDDADGRIGDTSIIGRRIGKMLDLSHNVVSEVTHETALQWREIREDRCAINAQQLFHRSEDSLIKRNAGRNLPSCRQHPIAQCECSAWLTSDEGVTTPTLTVFH